MTSLISNLFPSLLGQRYDVVVVGAGVAGLQAAYDLQRAGLSCIVLEARDRIGGKTLTSDRQPAAFRQKHKIVQDLGANWINDTNQSKIWELAKEFGLTTIVQNTTGNVVVEDVDGSLVTFPYGDIPKYASREDTDACVAIRDLVERNSVNTLSASERKELDSMSFETFLHLYANNSKAKATARVWTHAMLGVDPSEVSALYYIEYCRAGGGLMTMRSDGKGGGQYLRIKEGVSSFAEGMARRLTSGTIKLNSPVIDISEDSSSDAVVVKTKTGQTFHTCRVIVTVPTPIYNTITFNPSLPVAKQTYANSTSYGSYIKFFVAFDRPFWRDRGFCGLAQSFIGPVSVFRDTSIDDASPPAYCLTCFIGGTFGRKWSVLPTQVKLDSVLQQVSNVFNGGADVSGLLVDSMESPWMGEEWSGWGCPCASPPPGVMEACWDAFLAPAGKVHFAGTEMASIWRGYMDGALRTAESAATEVIAALKEEKAKL